MRTIPGLIVAFADVGWKLCRSNRKRTDAAEQDDRQIPLLIDAIVNEPESRVVGLGAKNRSKCRSAVVGRLQTLYGWKY